MKLLSIVRCLADMPTSVHFMGTGRINGQTAGFFGTISSVIALYNLWGLKV